jgi:hypothetical protein
MRVVKFQFLNPESFRTKKRISVADICKHRTISENVDVKSIWQLQNSKYNEAIGHPFLCAAENNGLHRPHRYIKSANN